MEASGGGKWAWSWMLPQPETICQLPYSVEREEPERVFSAANLRGDSDMEISALMCLVRAGRNWGKENTKKIIVSLIKKKNPS